MSEYANEKLFREYPWMWAVCKGYSQTLNVRVKDLDKDELARPALETHWLILDMSDRWIVEQIPDSLATLGHSLAHKMIAHVEEFRRPLPAGKHVRVAYIVRRPDDMSYLILRPTAGMTVLEDAYMLTT